MAAPKGNDFWKMRSSHGRKPIFKKPEQLWDAAEQYFEWNKKNPLKEQKVFHSQGVIKKTTINKMRAMTIMGLCIFLDISQQAWSEYKQRKGFGEVTRRIDEIIRTQKFEGASADMLNANIIARDLGLADKKELSGPDGEAIRVESDLSDAQLEAIIKSQGKKG